MNRGDDARLCEHQHVAVALEILAVLGEAFPSEVGFSERVALDHRAHRSIENEDAACQLIVNRRGCGHGAFDISGYE